MTIIKQNYRLRWRFDFNDGKPSRRGMWSLADKNPLNGAWSVNKSNLALALIEYEDVETGRTGVFAECPGHDFVNFEWIASVSISVAQVGTERCEPALVGLTLVTRDHRLQVFNDGSSRLLPRTDEDKSTHLVGFGR